MDKLFLDTDVIMDSLTNRVPFAEEMEEIFCLVKEGKIKCFTSSLSFSNIFYLTSRFKSKDFARLALYKLRNLVSVSTIDTKVVNQAIDSGFKDFEDALQYYSALKTGVDFIITRNKKDYSLSEVPVFSGWEYLVQRMIKRNELI